MREELQQFASERAERIRLLQERQLRELEQFDEESTRRGFRYYYTFFYPSLHFYISVFIPLIILETEIFLL